MWLLSRHPTAQFVVLLSLSWGGNAAAGGGDSVSAGTPVPAVAERESRLDELTGRQIRRVEVRSLGKWFTDVPTVSRIRTGDLLDPLLVRREIRTLLDSAHYAQVEAQVLSEGDGVVLRFLVEPRRVLLRITISGSVIPQDELLEALGMAEGDELSDSSIDSLLAEIVRIHRERGYLSARPRLSLLGSDDALGVVLSVAVELGPLARVARRRFAVSPDPHVEGLASHLSNYGVEPGDPADESSLVAADRALMESLREAGWYRAQIHHRVDEEGSDALVVVEVKAGPRVLLAFEGNQTFGESQLVDTIHGTTVQERTARTMAETLEKHYESFGFLDARVGSRVDGLEESTERVTFTIREGHPVRVVAREYPCLTGERTPGEIGEEIDSFLSESLPGSELVGPVDPRKLDAALASQGATGARPVPYDPNPWSSYVSPVYERAMKHVQDLYRSEGYLSATVGPAQLLRRRCDPRSPPGECHPIGPLRRPPTTCSYDDIGLPLAEPAPDPIFGCVADPDRSVECEPTAVLHVPVKLGPRTRLWDVAFDGNDSIPEAQLAPLLSLEMGEPLSLSEVEQARRRLVEAYAEQGFAFADVITKVDVSPDKTRGRVSFAVREGEQVHVRNIWIRGARRTSERLIRGRVALRSGGLYQKSLVRDTEERLATLGVFASVQVGLEDPYVPAREKDVVIELVERAPQYFEGRPGFGTGEGFRLSLEYGHLNIAAEAIQVTLLAQLGYLPNELILEPDVREKYVSEVDTVGKRLERRISLNAAFPDVGLGPLFRLGIEGIDVRDNARDFTLTKDAAGATLSFLPSRRLTFQFGPSLERNDVGILGSTQKGALLDYVRANPNRANVFRVPEGTSGAFAQRVSATWDRRDLPLGATEGSLLTATLEHVSARPLGASAGGSADETNPFAASDSEFLRFTSRVGLYLPLSRRKTSLALSFRWGLNHQLRAGSRTYPDRLFFLGGIDSVRGLLQDSMIPDDVAAQLLDPRANLTVDDVVIRGGNFFVNPRAELRIPLTTAVQTALFIDAGNLWSRSPTEGSTEGLESRYQPKYWRLRYSTGTGLRVNTPVGPLVFDYGFNVDRVLDQFFPRRKNQRYWEGLGAFHFSIGLF
jgi:outer membrane protein insertion porin family